MKPERRDPVTFAICIFLLTVFAPVSRADTLVMPRELVDFAHASGCTPIDDFFERPGKVSPPYAYGWLAGIDGDSAVFWCKKVEKSAKPYSLIFTVRDRKSFVLASPSPKQLAGCSATIEWWNSPAGLSIKTRHNLALRYFSYVTAPQRAVPTTVVANARVIVDDNSDGVISTFYCYGGQWLVNIQD